MEQPFASEILMEAEYGHHGKVESTEVFSSYHGVILLKDGGSIHIQSREGSPLVNHQTISRDGIDVAGGETDFTHVRDYKEYVDGILTEAAAVVR